MIKYQYEKDYEIVFRTESYSHVNKHCHGDDFNKLTNTGSVFYVKGFKGDLG